MSSNNNMINQGIAAFQAGDIKQAGRLLSQVVKEDKTNEQAWYYLAQCFQDPEKRKQCLQTVLKINPANTTAQRELSELTGDSPFDTPPSVVERNPKESLQEAKAAAFAKASAAASHEFDTKKLSFIPGAPERFSFNNVINVFKDSISVVTTRNIDLSKASWWNFWITVAVTGIVISLANMIAYISLYTRLDISIDFLYLITMPVFILVTTFAALWSSSSITYWYLSKFHSGTGTLMGHSYTVAAIWAPASIILAIILIVQSFMDRAAMISLEVALRGGLPSNATGGMYLLTAIGLAISVFTIYLLALNFSKLHKVNGRPVYLAAIAAIVVIAFIF